MTKTATVVGAGIAGPAAAITLQNRGYDVTVYEKRPAPYAGSIHMITLETATEAILWHMGIARDEIYPSSHWDDSLVPHVMEESRGQEMVDHFEGWPIDWPARWNDVHNALARRVNVKYGVTVNSVPNSDIVVWADGISSYGRKLLSPRNGEYAGEMLFRGYCPRPRNDTTWYNFQGDANANDKWEMVSYPTWTDNGENVRGWTLFMPIPREPWDDTETLTRGQMLRLATVCSPIMHERPYQMINRAVNVTAAPQIIWPHVGHIAFTRNGQRHFVIGDANGTVSPRTGLGANAAIYEATNSKPNWERLDISFINELLDRSRENIGEAHSLHG